MKTALFWDRGIVLFGQVLGLTVMSLATRWTVGGRVTSTDLISGQTSTFTYTTVGSDKVLRLDRRRDFLQTVSLLVLYGCNNVNVGA